jgi:hypothetical protein
MPRWNENERPTIESVIQFFQRFTASREEGWRGNVRSCFPPSFRINDKIRVADTMAAAVLFASRAQSRAGANASNPGVTNESVGVKYSNMQRWINSVLLIKGYHRNYCDAMGSDVILEDDLFVMTCLVFNVVVLRRDLLKMIEALHMEAPFNTASLHGYRARQTEVLRWGPLAADGAVSTDEKYVRELILMGLRNGGSDSRKVAHMLRHLIAQKTAVIGGIVYDLTTIEGVWNAAEALIAEREYETETDPVDRRRFDRNPFARICDRAPHEYTLDNMRPRREPRSGSRERGQWNRPEDGAEAAPRRVRDKRSVFAVEGSPRGGRGRRGVTERREPAEVLVAERILETKNASGPTRPFQPAEVTRKPLPGFRPRDGGAKPMWAKKNSYKADPKAGFKMPTEDQMDKKPCWYCRSNEEHLKGLLDQAARRGADQSLVPNHSARYCVALYPEMEPEFAEFLASRRRGGQGRPERINHGGRGGGGFR